MPTTTTQWVTPRRTVGKTLTWRGKQLTGISAGTDPSPTATTRTDCGCKKESGTSAFDGLSLASFSSVARFMYIKLLMADDCNFVIR